MYTDSSTVKSMGIRGRHPSRGIHHKPYSPNGESSVERNASFLQFRVYTRESLADFSDKAKGLVPTPGP